MKNLKENKMKKIINNLIKQNDKSKLIRLSINNLVRLQKNIAFSENDKKQIVKKVNKIFKKLSMQIRQVDNLIKIDPFDPDFYDLKLFILEVERIMIDVNMYLKKYNLKLNVDINTQFNEIWTYLSIINNSEIEFSDIIIKEWTNDIWPEFCKFMNIPVTYLIFAALVLHNDKTITLNNIYIK
jgi:hypothetical protein